MASRDEIRSMIGAEAYDRGSNMIGRVAEVYVDEGTQDPTWILLPAGLFRSRPALAPLHGATVIDPGRRIQLAVDRAQVDDAPPPDDATDEPLSTQYVQRLQRHYHGQEDGPDDAMTRSEQQLRVGTERRPARRVRLVKYVDTEYVQVPVRREKVRLEEQDVTGGVATDIPGGPVTAASEDGTAEPAVDLTLHEQRVVIGTQTVPVERVRLTTRTTTDNADVEEQLSKERIDVEHPDGHTEHLGP
jgi:stress response protein YsnF